MPHPASSARASPGSTGSSASRCRGSPRWGSARPTPTPSSRPPPPTCPRRSAATSGCRATGRTPARSTAAGPRSWSSSTSSSCSARRWRRSSTPRSARTPRRSSRTPASSRPSSGRRRPAAGSTSTRMPWRADRSVLREQPAAAAVAGAAAVARRATRRLGSHPSDLLARPVKGCRYDDTDQPVDRDRQPPRGGARRRRRRGDRARRGRVAGGRRRRGDPGAWPDWVAQTGGDRDAEDFAAAAANGRRWRSTPTPTLSRLAAEHHAEATAFAKALALVATSAATLGRTDPQAVGNASAAAAAQLGAFTTADAHPTRATPADRPARPTGSTRSTRASGDSGTTSWASSAR